MTSPTTARNQQRSRLLQLPREVRDIIFEYVLVRHVIPIEAAVVKINETTAMRSPGYANNIKKRLPCRFPWSHRRLWPVPVIDVVCDFGPRDRTEDPRSTRSISMTYQLASYPETSGNFGDLRLLRTCQQIFVEAREIFYSKNIFSFSAEFQIGTAFAFLCDRPPESLRLIRSIELSMSEDHNMRAADGAHYPNVGRSTDSLVLQYAYNHFTDLTTLLSTPRMQLRRLYLNISTPKQNYDAPPKSIDACVAWETSKMRFTPMVASWVNPLLNIEGLESIEIYWSFARPYIRRMVNTLLLMKHHMLKGAVKSTHLFETPVEDRKLRISIQQSYGQPFVGEYDEDLSWKDYDFAADGTWEASKPVGQSMLGYRGYHSTHSQGPHLAPADGYKCYCRLA